MNNVIKLASDVRAAQTAYFADRSRENLVRSKELEKQFDDLLARYSAPARIPGDGIESRRAAANAIAELAGDVIGDLGFAFSWNLDESNEGPNLGDVYARAMRLSLQSARVGCWAWLNGTNEPDGANDAPTTDDAVAVDRGTTVAAGDK